MPEARKYTLLMIQVKYLSYDSFLSLVVYMYLSIYPKTKKIAVPIQASGEIDIVAKKYYTDIVRVKDSHFAIMNATADPDVELAGGTKGGVIFPDFPLLQTECFL